MGAPLVLVAASGLAREVLALLRLHPLHDVVGLVDDDQARQGTTVDGVPVLGEVAALAGMPGVQVLVCAGRGTVREKLVARLAALGVEADRYATVVHPGVELAPGCNVGVGSIVLAGTVLTAAVTVGEHVVVMPHVTLTHDDTVADFATLCAGVTLGGGVAVGRAAYLGMSAAVRENLHVGARSTLGMGSALLADLPDGQTWAGVPARPLRAAGAPVAEMQGTRTTGAATAPEEKAGAA